MTINLKNNRDETPAGDFVFNGNVELNGEFSPPVTTGSLPSLNASHVGVIPIYNGNDGTIIGYVKVFPLA